MAKTKINAFINQHGFSCVQPLGPNKKGTISALRRFYGRKKIDAGSFFTSRRKNIERHSGIFRRDFFFPAPFLEALE